MKKILSKKIEYSNEKHKINSMKNIKFEKWKLKFEN